VELTSDDDPTPAILEAAYRPAPDQYPEIMRYVVRTDLGILDIDSDRVEVLG
jgi:hypothetical protein